jgi:hypothetical protein
MRQSQIIKPIVARYPPPDCKAAKGFRGPARGGSNEHRMRPRVRKFTGIVSPSSPGSAKGPRAASTMIATAAVREANSGRAVRSHPPVSYLIQSPQATRVKVRHRQYRFARDGAYDDQTCGRN